MQGYIPTTLEKWISDRFIQKGIFYPWELTPKQIAGAFDIDFDADFSPAFSSEEFGEPFIVVDKRTSQEMQKEQFFHELGHILRHDGDQRDENMPESFRMMQEADAHLFTLYAAIPYHMLDFSANNTIESIIERFNVSNEIAKNRVLGIKRKLYYQRPIKQNKPINLQRFHPNQYSKETQKILQQLKNQTGVSWL
ncbi:hypothetical protein GCM10011391_28500 [Pullulanibacillus camelliae]|uniref:IrrE N-terminal-like domain-containing protein n=1 Tax=Pullulanibacillus camelliae TaxID=1707096 RepID=A0A8J2YK96_9BACL|nr:ImmA/IrrE family metallo-endopeptidase [Pullulanibacillus camelliae]GGE48010.1 hypothetical protein GCM10011391_28500 [Pullulanibacillus camelliae]